VLETAVVGGAALIAGNTTYCQHPPQAYFNVTRNAINLQACITLTPGTDAGNNFKDSSGNVWLPAGQQPGHGLFDDGSGSGLQPYKFRDWSFASTPDTTCVDIFGKPYFKVYGGDVRVGDRIASLDCTNATASTAGYIKGWNRASDGTYAGAGVQYAAIAMNTNEGFASGQNAVNANPSFGGLPSPARAMSFANTSGTIYGGDFDASQNCTQYVPTGTAPLVGDRSIGPLPVGGQTTVYVVGNVYIDGDIKYTSLGATPKTLTQYRLVVEGNIYIDHAVHQLDGTYVAVPNPSTGVGGTIVTCAIGHVVPSNTLSGCEDQLVVNGALVGTRVRLLRDCGSLKYSPDPAVTRETTLFSGASGNQELCSAGVNHAAEIFNYSPELWLASLKSVGGSGGDDSIRTLPPIL
jgi:hypothetical protein